MPYRSHYSVGDLLARGLSRLSVEAITHGPMKSPQAVVEAILQHHIDCLVGVPSEMVALSQYPGRKHIPSEQIRSIWLGAHKARCGEEEEISRAWGCRVFQQYGITEMCPGGGVQCLVRNGFHLREADLYIEIVDPETAMPVVDGTYGEVVVTTLTREAMPLVRYRTGHKAAIMATPCPCGTVLRRLEQIESRVANEAILKGGTTLNPKKELLQ